MLRFAAECGDFLVVGVLADSLAPIAHLHEDIRLDGVSAINWVGHAFVLEDTPANFIEALQPAVVVMGKEHENTINPEKGAVEVYGGQLLFGSGDTIFSSLELLHLETELLDSTSIIKPTEYIERNRIDLSALDVLLAKMQGLKVCVIGDIIVDEYIQCDPLGMSQEDPTIVVTPIMSNKF